LTSKIPSTANAISVRMITRVESLSFSKNTVLSF